MLVHHPENDNKDSGDKSPSEETDFSPEGPAVFALLGFFVGRSGGRLLLRHVFRWIARKRAVLRRGEAPGLLP